MATMFQDTMDNSRLVRPIRQEGRQTLCDIFWKENGTFCYGGRAYIPTSLFSEDPRIAHIGFVATKFVS